MSARTLRNLVLALVAAAALWGLATILAGPPSGPGEPSALQSFFSFERDSIRAIHVRAAGGDLVELTRDGTGWRANGFEADSGAVERLIGLLVLAEVGDLVATNEETHGRLGVAADSTSTLELRFPGSSRGLVVGKAGPRFGTTYARLPDQSDVYLVDQDLAPRVSRSLDDWRNKTIAAVDTTAAERVEVRRDGDAYQLVRGDSLWTLDDGTATEQRVVRTVQRELAELRGSGFVAPGDSLAALEVNGAIVVLGESGDTLALIELAAAEEGDGWMSAVGDSILYRVPAYRFDLVAPARDSVVGGVNPPRP